MPYSRTPKFRFQRVTTSPTKWSAVPICRSWAISPLFPTFVWWPNRRRDGHLPFPLVSRTPRVHDCYEGATIPNGIVVVNSELGVFRSDASSLDPTRYGRVSSDQGAGRQGGGTQSVRVRKPDMSYCKSLIRMLRKCMSIANLDAIRAPIAWKMEKLVGCVHCHASVCHACYSSTSYKLRNFVRFTKKIQVEIQPSML